MASVLVAYFLKHRRVFTSCLSLFVSYLSCFVSPSHPPHLTHRAVVS